MTEVEQRPYLTLHEAAQHLQKSVDECYRLVRTGELPYVRVGRSIRIPFYAVDGLLAMERTQLENGADRGPDAAMPGNGTEAGPHLPPGVTPIPPDFDGAGMADPRGPLVPHHDPESWPIHPNASGPSFDGRLRPGGQPQAPAPAPTVVGPETAPDSITIKSLISPGAQASGASQEGAAAPRGRRPVPGRPYFEIPVRLPFRTTRIAVVVVSDANLRAVLTKGRKVRSWGTVSLKEGVVREGAVVDPQGFIAALASLEAKLAGPRMVGRPMAVVVSGRNLVVGRFRTTIPDGPGNRGMMRDIVCEKLTVRPEDVTVDYYIEGGEASNETRKKEASGEAETPPGPREVVGIAALRAVLDSVLEPVALAGSRITIAQPKAVSLAAAAAVPAGIVVDLEPTSIAVIILRDGLADVVREVTVAPGLSPSQVAQILAGQVNRSVGYYNARYPDDHLPSDTPIFVTGEGAVSPEISDLALATLPYPRRVFATPFLAPDNFPAGAYAAALGLAQQVMDREARGAASRRVFDFLPEEFRPRPLPVKKLVAAGVAAVLLAGLFPAYQVTADASAGAASLEATVGRLEPEVRIRTLQLRQIAAMQEQLKTAAASVEKLVAAEEAIRGSDRAFAETLRRLRGAVPAGVDLGEVDDDGILVEVDASAADPTDLFTFIRSLAAVEGFGDVRIKSVTLDQSGVQASVKFSRDAAVLGQSAAP